MKNKLYYIICTTVLALASVSCNRHLDTIPDSTLDINIDTEDKVAELLTAAYPKASYFAFLEPRTDNVAERQGGMHFRLNDAMYHWRDYEQEDLDTPLNYWLSCYQGIAQANHALEHLKKLPKNNRTKALYGEAFLIRAYLHFMLVNIWSKHYNSATADSDLGIPYITKPETEALKNYSRGTVADVYKKIEEDLLLGFSLVDDAYYKIPKYHFNKEAAYAFATRFYLYKGDWDKVIEYSNWLLSGDSSLRLRDWMGHYRTFIFNGQNLGTYYASVEEQSNLLIVSNRSRMYRNYSREKYGLNNNLVKVLFGTGYTRETRDATWGYYYSGGEFKIQHKFSEYEKFGNTGLNPTDVFVAGSLFSMDEVLLNRAEALAMKGRDNEAVFDIQNFMKKKTFMKYTFEEFVDAFPNAKTTYTPAYELSDRQARLVQFIAELRRKEFVHEGMRWFDIRRFDLVVDRNTTGSQHDDNKILKKGDKRKLIQIPSQAISLGLEAN
ncbi:MAG: RagB/SusD family nutrient uptake outer membrane protein [Cruoricaptor ignavus]|nr:RagB/SusD family nutrient uptake outer membrane protein [Cruoricaptor ignavus]